MYNILDNDRYCAEKNKNDFIENMTVKQIPERGGGKKAILTGTE